MHPSWLPTWLSIFPGCVQVVRLDSHNRRSHGHSCTMPPESGNREAPVGWVAGLWCSCERKSLLYIIWCQSYHVVSSVDKLPTSCNITIYGEAGFFFFNVFFVKYLHFFKQPGCKLTVCSYLFYWVPLMNFAIQDSTLSWGLWRNPYRNLNRAPCFRRSSFENPPISHQSNGTSRQAMAAAVDQRLSAMDLEHQWRSCGRWALHSRSNWGFSWSLLVHV